MVCLEGLGNLKKFSDLIGTQTRDLLACSIAFQPSTLLHAPCNLWSGQFNHGQTDEESFSRVKGNGEIL
jgi:hypothetical protein